MDTQTHTADRLHYQDHKLVSNTVVGNLAHLRIFILRYTNVLIIIIIIMQNLTNNNINSTHSTVLHHYFHNDWEFLRATF